MSKNDEIKDGDARVYCICKNPRTTGMVGCDTKGCAIEWYHYECVGLTEDTVPDGNWHCPTCRKNIADITPAAKPMVFICEYCEEEFNDKRQCLDHKKQHLDDFYPAPASTSTSPAAAQKVFQKSSSKKRKNPAPRKHVTTSSANVSSISASRNAPPKTSLLDERTSDVMSARSSERGSERGDVLSRRSSELSDVISARSSDRRDAMTPSSRLSSPHLPASPMFPVDALAEDYNAPANNTDDFCPAGAQATAPVDSSPAASANPPTSAVSERTKQILDGFSDEAILEELVKRREAFLCVCGTVFRDQALYFLHRGIHNTNNPRKCATCDFQARDWYHFMSHLFVHKQKPASTTGGAAS